MPTTIIWDSIHTLISCNTMFGDEYHGHVIGSWKRTSNICPTEDQKSVTTMMCEGKKLTKGGRNCMTGSSTDTNCGNGSLAYRRTQS